MIDALGQMLSSPLMQRALVVTVLVGVSAPVIGTYLVQRGMALMGDGIGHVSLTGVAIGWLTAGALNLAPRDVLAVPGAIAASIVGAVLIELVRAHGRTGGDVALAMLFYGGIAGGGLLMGLADSTSANLMRYLFGSVAVVLPEDVLYTAVMAAAILAVGIGLRGPLFALSHDADFARSCGLPVRTLNVLVAVVAALTVSVAMRVVGVLLVSAVMIVPVAIAQLLSHSFVRTMAISMGIGVAVSVVGLVTTYFKALPSGATIVIMLIALYIMAAVGRAAVGVCVRR